MFDKTYKKATLSKVDIETIQMLLKKSVEDYNTSILKDTSYEGIKRPLLELPTYKRQLIAVTNTKGEKEVFVNCICASMIPHLDRTGFNWRKEYFKVNDGGPCYFRVLLNLTTREYHYFKVNGYA